MCCANERLKLFAVLVHDLHKNDRAKREDNSIADELLESNTKAEKLDFD